MSWWIGTIFGPLANLVDACWVEADSEQEAADALCAWFDSEEGRSVLNPDGRGEDRFDRLFVIPADAYSVYDVALRTTGKSALQCCGGDTFGGGHSGHCPGTEGQGE